MLSTDQEITQLTTIVKFVRVEVLTAVKIQVEVFWVETPCSVVVGYRRFGVPCCLHLHYTAAQPRRLRLELLITRRRECNKTGKIYSA